MNLPLLLHILQKLPPTDQELSAVLQLPTVNLGLEDLFQLEQTGMGKLSFVQQIRRLSVVANLHTGVPTKEDLKSAEIQHL